VSGLDLTPYTYLQESQRTITLFYLLSSLLKALVFAFVIAWIGCQRGFQVRGEWRRWRCDDIGRGNVDPPDRDRGFGFAVVLHYVG